ncbi:MAG: hypothetical protein E6R03_06500 [Hyphomicrobiaceae bacterium]|nr:MAG: hypothetical protein E6R03_06500 [Hyphomicrobiaceae bacterium]
MSAFYLKARALVQSEKENARLREQIKELQKINTRHRQTLAYREQMIVDLLNMTIRPADVGPEAWKQYQRLRRKFIEKPNTHKTMGQYHKTYNKDKKEFINPSRIDCGLKLMEQVGEDGTSTALLLLLANSNGRGGGDAEDHPMVGAWAGDRIVVQGDYAEFGDPGYIPPEELEAYEDISEQVAGMLRAQRF